MVEKDTIKHTQLFMNLIIVQKLIIILKVTFVKYLNF